MRKLIILMLSVASVASGQPTHKFPPDSLTNTQVIPRSTPVIEVVGMMRNFTSALGVRCTFCHVGSEGEDLAEYDFASDQKRNKLVARQMLRMLAEVNARLDTIPGRTHPAVTATCMTCHHGVSRPVPLATLIQETTVAVSADSALSAYKVLREKYYGKDSYDFSEGSLNIAAFRIARAGKVSDALKILDYNETLYPKSSGMSVFRGNILLMKGDTTAAETAFREAIRRDSTNNEAKGRLKAIGKAPPK
ncbi:MAG TPA: c-type cytochrome [Gemmatimonadaceae bacterium]|nr:c-type cytochrome [Gemmatimonadaceae bacterium]